MKERELNNLMRFLPGYEVRVSESFDGLCTELGDCDLACTFQRGLPPCPTGLANELEEWAGAGLCTVLHWLVRAGGLRRNHPASVGAWHAVDRVPQQSMRECSTAQHSTGLASATASKQAHGGCRFTARDEGLQAY